jgi:hypothetical protein
MGSLENRLRNLEAVYAHSPRGSEAGGGGSGGTRELIGGVLVAIAHVRRAPIDHPPHGYQIEKLHDLEPMALAQFVAALALLRHPHEYEAREILAETEAEPALWSLIDAVVDRLTFSQEREVSF